MEYQSGCNYWINQGINEFEPIGTATSMHDCGDCKHLDICLVKKETDVWEYNKETHDELWRLSKERMK